MKLDQYTEELTAENEKVKERWIMTRILGILSLSYCLG